MLVPRSAFVPGNGQKEAQCPLSEKAFQTHTPKKEKGSFERWDLRRGSDSWAQREMGRE